MSDSLDDIRSQTLHIRQFLHDTVSLSEVTADGVAEVSLIVDEFNRAVHEVVSGMSGLDREAGRLSGMIHEFHL